MRETKWNPDEDIQQELTIGNAGLVNNLIVESNQESGSVDIRGNGDREFPFRILNSGNKISVDFGQKADETF